MTSFAFLCLGLGIGLFAGAWWMNQVLKRAEDFWNGCLDFYAERVSELTEQVMEMRDKRESGDEWKDQ